MKSCPCGLERALSECCGQYHAGLPAPDAETLMRSRYSAYVLHLADYLLATWHASTRPSSESLSLQDDTRWLGLKIVHCSSPSKGRAIVEFIARYKQLGFSAQKLHERSEFILEDGPWFYVNGDFL